ncbi:hypothetical protein KIW84_075379 [Lathyrus oleraceus]|uniref:Uncharacterized protein n=1 Tax=Pisum sativum TaxID=3888 RepID=A0A9D4VTJ3_PEA|nr:hypothetical protein KIW84_075379 [Pisum sativum]
MEVCRRNRTIVLCTAATEHQNHHILSPSASVRVAVVAPAAMFESYHSEHSDADTHKSANTGDLGQPKNTTFRGFRSEFHPALAPDPISVEEVEELRAKVQKLELEKSQLQLKLDQTTKENKDLKRESQEKDKALNKSSKRVKCEEGKRKWI